MNVLKTIKMRQPTLKEKEEFLKTCENNIKVEIIYMLLMVIITAPIAIKESFMEMTSFEVGIVCYSVGLLVLYIPIFIGKKNNKKRRAEIKNGSLQCVKATCLRVRKSLGRNNIRYEYDFITEFDEKTQKTMLETLGGKLKEGDKIIIFKIGENDFSSLKDKGDV